MKKSMAIGLGNLGNRFLDLGRLKDAAMNYRRRIDLCREIEDRFLEAVGHAEYGRLLAYCGDWAGVAAELDTALEQFTAEGDIQGAAVTWLYRALAILLAQARHHAQKARNYAWCDGPPHAYQPALDEADRLLELVGGED